MEHHAHRNRLPRLRRQRVAWKIKPPSRRSVATPHSITSCCRPIIPSRTANWPTSCSPSRLSPANFPPASSTACWSAKSGTGKTHLAVAALRILISRGFEGLFFDYQNLLDRIRAGYNQASGSADREAYRFALDTEVLLLDDLGAHRVTDWVEDTVTSIITYRCNNKKPLIATTNLPDPDAGSVMIDRSTLGKPDYKTSLADRIGSRARSRLFEMCKVVRMPLVEDYRLRRSL